MKCRYRWITLLLVIFGGGFFLFLWVSAGRLASPPRRELQEYRRSYFKSPSEHGLVVRPEIFLEGKVPILIVRPDALAGPGKRGAVLRAQLGERGQALAPFGEERALLVLLHGRNGRKEDLLPVAERFCAVGFVCVIPDLPAHGESPVETVAFGARAFEMELPGKVIDEALVYLGRNDLPQSLWGMSMGGAFAIHAASLEPMRWDKMVVVASFDSLEGVVRDSMGVLSGLAKPIFSAMIKWRGGADLTRVNPRREAAKISIPVFVVHGDCDELIDQSRGRTLFDGFAGPKKFLSVSGGTHQNVLITEAPVYAEMASWFLSGK